MSVWCSLHTTARIAFNNNKFNNNSDYIRECDTHGPKYVCSKTDKGKCQRSVSNASLYSPNKIRISYNELLRRIVQLIKKNNFFL